VENEIGNDLFFICNGRVAVIHKKTKTYVKRLGDDDSFGEIGFFSNLPRQSSVIA
jgi:CRP-like cAMP-binding protein